MDLSWMVGQDHVKALLEDLGPEPRSFRVWGPPGTGVSRLTVELSDEGHDAYQFETMADLLPEDRVRAIIIRLRRIPEQLIADHLFLFHVETEAYAHLIAQRAQGNMKLALEMATTCPTPETFERTYGTPNLAPGLLDALRKGDLPRAVDVCERYAAFSPEPETLIDDAIASLREELSTSPEPKRIVAAIRGMWELRDPMASAHRMPARAKLTIIMATLADLFYTEPIVRADLDEVVPLAALREATAWAQR